MDIIQVVKGDTGPALKATVTRADTGGAFVGSGSIALRIRKKGTSTVLANIAMDSDNSNLSGGILVFSLQEFLAPSVGDGPDEGFYEGEIEFTLSDGKIMSVFELIDIKVRDDFG
tara:strand:+ start:518 stop:862 length:345 start_codon:yes stop_codon:yes gene_type:complete